MATQSNITGLFIGEDWTITDTIKDTNGNPIDITGFTLVFAMVKVQGGLVLVQKVTPTQVTISNQTTNKGQCVITGQAQDTAGFREGLYWWSISRTDSGTNTNMSNGTIPLQKRS